MKTETAQALEQAKFDQKSVGHVAQKAMLVSVSFSRWTAIKSSKAGANVICNEFGVKDNKMVRSTHDLIPSKAFNEVNAVIRAAQNYMYSVTSPWFDDGTRIIPGTKLLDFAEKMANYKTEFYKASNHFIEVTYPMYIKNIKEVKGRLYNPSDYPSPEELKNKFAFIVYGPFKIPTGNDNAKIGFEKNNWMAEYSKDELEWLQISANESVVHAIKTVQNDIWRRISKKVSEIPDKLRKYHKDEDGKSHNAFHSTVISNLVDVLELCRELNVSDDPEIFKEIEQIQEEICGHTGSELKTDASLRIQVANKADAILNRLGKYI